MISFTRLIELWEPLGMLAPVKFSRVYNYTGNCCAVSTDPFSSRVSDNVGPVFNWAYKEAACTEGVVDNDRNTSVMCDFDNSFKIGNVIPT